jgi:uncharacterized phosphatase
MTHLALVRHGQTDWNLAKRIQGSTDIPLNATGRAEAKATAEVLAESEWDGILTSPLGRAVETAEIMANVIDLGEPETVEALMERRYGVAEGLEFDELHRRYPAQSTVPGRETHAELRQRVHEALMEIAEKRPGQSLILVTHGGVISSLVRYATNGARPRADERIPNGSVHYFSYLDGQLRLDEFNGVPASSQLLEAAPAREALPEAPALTPPS